MSEFIKTVLFEEMTWLPPVERADQLPVSSDIAEGSLCYVATENAVYQYYAGVWVLNEGRGAPESFPDK